MKDYINFVKAHSPVVLAVALVVVNALIDAGFVNLPQNVITTVNVVLAASGLTVLHVRQKQG